MYPRLLLALLLLLLPPLAQARERKPLAVATTAMIADVVEAVAGDVVEVRTLIPAGVDPHLYSPTRDDVTVLSRARLVFHNGHKLEGRLADALRRLERSRRVVAVTEGLPEDLLLRDPANGHVDPHLWMDPAIWGRVAATVAEALAAELPADRERFLAAAEAWRTQMTELDAWARRALATVPAERRVLITAHDAFRYFGRAYEVEVHGIQGLSTESEAGLRDLNRLVDLMVTRRIGAVFVESTVADKNVRALIEGARARGHTVALGGTLFSDAMGPAGTPEGTYPGMIRHNVRTIVKALGGRSDVEAASLP